MEKTVTATEVARKLSDILNAVKYNGSYYTIVRGGKPVACISPIDKPGKAKTLGELKELIRKVPALGEESERFQKDVKEVIKKQPMMPENRKWA